MGRSSCLCHGCDIPQEPKYFAPEAGAGAEARLQRAQRPTMPLSIFAGALAPLD